MTAVAKEATVPEGLVRVYLVSAESVAQFHDLLRKAERKAEGDSNDEEIDTLWGLVRQVEQVFGASTIVKARLK